MDVSALHETAKVSLSVNISFGLYLIFKEQEDLNSIVAEQIADNLNISMDRIKHINVSFDFGSINKTGYQIQKLSHEKYKEYFPNDSLAGDPKSTSKFDEFGADSKSPTSSSRQKRAATARKKNNVFVNANYPESNKIPEQKNSYPDSSISLSISGNYKQMPQPVLYSNISVMTITPLKKRKQRSKITWGKLITEIIIRNDDKNASLNYGANTKNTEKKLHDDIERARRTNNERKPIQGSNTAGATISLENKFEKRKNDSNRNQWLKLQQLSFDHDIIRANATKWDTLLSLLQPLKFQEETINQSISEQKIRQLKQDNTAHEINNESEIYLSPPFNKNNDRMLLESNSEVNFDQPMAMRISFILVPPGDPESDEEEAMVLLKKIGDLITDREFTLLVSGNKVSVVNSDDPEDDAVKANQFCPWGVMFIVYDDEFTIMEMDNITMLYVNKTKTYHGIGRFDLWVMVKGQNNAYETSVTNLKEYAFICFMPRILQVDCQRISLGPDEYQVMSTNNRSIIFEENEYNITTYSVLNETTGEIQICVPQSYDPNKGQLLPHYFSVSKGCGSEFDEVRRAEGYLTLILGRVSIAAQALVLFTYFLFPSLRNLPGCNIMNLTLALFIAETIFEEGMLVRTQWRCVTVAITLHFFFLASHFWMNVMSFDVFRAFSNSSVSTSNKNEKRSYFPKYCLYAWGMPAIIVSFCSLIEFSDLFAGVEIGYGGVGRKHINPNISVIYSNFLFGNQPNVIQDVKIIEEDIDATFAPNENITFTDYVAKDNQSACWIQNPLASLLAFGAPILLIFISNCIFFIRTIMTISRTVRLSNESLYRQRSNSSYSKTTGRSEVMLYLRMSTVMGFTWVFGFSSAIISSVAKPINTTICIVVHVHSILFVILNISQGLFIFVAFVCNRRVLRLYAGLFFRLKRFVRRKSYKSRIYTVSSNSALGAQSTKSTTLSQS